ncbi:MAG: bifunctional oligoribonuclease/PAP phosphatase NrnA [Candidatus Doudnabacteria bacterium]|nr:bifunctional oligoribonuclease/PAP phosphatase NrnA [Candidatus Doudnabacteria bacterium]
MSNIKLQFQKAWDLINQADKIFLTTHEGTDGDDLGSLLAIKLALQKQNKQISACIKELIPSNLHFLPGLQDISQNFIDQNYDLVIIFGCNKLERTGFDQLRAANCPIINFDHHPDNSNFGSVNIVDPNAAAVAELVYNFLKFGEVTIDKQIATCLLTGIFTDTGGFKHANTSPSALEAAAALMKKGARIEKIASSTMTKHKPAAVRAWAKGLENTRFDPEKQMVFSALSENDLEEIGATPDDMEGFVEMLNNIPQAKFALFLRQEGDVVKGSLRSEPHKGVDVSKIARTLGGGGHKLAAGFKIKGRLTKDRDLWKIV